MPSKKDRPSKSKKKNAGSVANDGHDEPQGVGMQQSVQQQQQQNNPVVSRLGLNEASPHYHPAYRDESGYPMSNYPPSGAPNFPAMQPHHNFPNANQGLNGSALNNTSPSPTPSPASFPSVSTGRGQIVENGYSHSSPAPPQPSLVPNSNFPGSSADKETYFNKVLESNAHLILRINQAMADNQPEVVGELMQALSKNIHVMNGTPAVGQQQAGSPTDVAVTTSSSHARISQSPLPVRPSGAPASSAYPGTASQAPYTTQNGPSSFQPQQGRPQPVYSPLAQSTHGGAFPPRSPSMQTFQQPPQMVNGYITSPNRAGQQPPQQYSQQTPQQQQQQPMMQPQQGVPHGMPYGTPHSSPQTSSHATPQHPPQAATSNTSMPPPQNYPYHPNQSRSVSSQGYPVSTYPNYPPQQETSQMDPNYSLMPPPQMHPRRSSSSNSAYRPPSSSHPQGQMINQQQQAPSQMAYQQRPYMDTSGYPPQQAQQHQPYSQYQQGPQQGQPQPNQGTQAPYYGNVPSIQQQYSPMAMGQYKGGQPTGPPYDGHGNSTGS